MTELTRAAPQARPARRAAEKGPPVPEFGAIGLAAFIPYLVNRLSALWNAGLQPDLRAADLSTIKMRTLAVLSLTPGLTVNDLAIFTVSEQSTISRTLDAMEEQGLILRKARDADLRMREAFLTADGRAAFAAFWPRMHARYETLLRGLTADERRALAGLLHKLMRNLEPDL
jgi:MarR family transcriptional regulator, transcriptional regulator for hemolysin